MLLPLLCDKTIPKQSTKKLTPVKNTPKSWHYYCAEPALQFVRNHLLLYELMFLMPYESEKYS